MSKREIPDYASKFDPEAIIFETVHGSRLYGLDHAGSDNDSFIVYAQDLTGFHDHRGKEDVVRIGLADFLNKALGGSHQSLEALFSKEKIYHNKGYESFLEAAVVPAGPVREKYRRTIHKFCFEDYKRRRHALRLALNLADLTEFGRFDPHLNEYRAELVSSTAHYTANEDLYRLALLLAKME